MLDGAQLYQELFDCMARCDQCIEDMLPLGSDLAEKERTYRISRRKRTVMERLKGTAVSIIRDVVVGYEDISTMRFERDNAQYAFDQNHEALLFNKKKCDILEKIIEREWGAR